MRLHGVSVAKRLLCWMSRQKTLTSFQKLLLDITAVAKAASYQGAPPGGLTVGLTLSLP